MADLAETPLRRLRIARGLSLEAVAEALEMNNSTLSRIERGQGTTPETAAALVKFFGHGITEMEVLYPERYDARSPSGQGASPGSP